MSATDAGASDSGVVNTGTGALSDAFFQNIPDDTSPQPHAAADVSLGVPPDAAVGAAHWANFAQDDTLIELCALLLVRTRSMILASLQARAIHLADAQWVVDQLVAGLSPAQASPAQAINLVDWLWLVHQMETHGEDAPSPLGSPDGDALRQKSSLPAPTWAELEELAQRVAHLAASVSAPYP